MHGTFLNLLFTFIIHPLLQIIVASKIEIFLRREIYCKIGDFTTTYILLREKYSSSDHFAHFFKLPFRDCFTKRLIKLEMFVELKYYLYYLLFQLLI